MSIRTILVPVRGDGKGEGVMDHAHSLAQRFGSHINVIHARAEPKDLLPFGVLMTEKMRATILAAAEQQAGDEEDRVRDLFNNYCSSHDLKAVSPADVDNDGNSVTWTEKTGKQKDLIGLYGRLADLVIVPKPDAELGINTLEAALMEAGALTLMCPPKQFKTLGENIAVAWNGNAEACRVVKAALPFLQKAKSVYLLSNNKDGEKDSLSASEMQSFLNHHGVNSQVQSIIRKKEIGQNLLKTAEDVGADMLVMGAYSHNRNRELVMGGATLHIIKKADMPILMLH